MGNNLQYPLSWSLCGPQIPSECFRIQKHVLPLWGFESRVVHPVTDYAVGSGQEVGTKGEIPVHVGNWTTVILVQSKLLNWPSYLVITTIFIFNSVGNSDSSRMVCEWRLRQNVEESSHNLIKEDAGIYFKGLRKTTKDSGHHCWRHCRDSNINLPIWTSMQCSVFNFALRCIVPYFRMFVMMAWWWSF